MSRRLRFEYVGVLCCWVIACDCESSAELHPADGIESPCADSALHVADSSTVTLRGGTTDDTLTFKPVPVISVKPQEASAVVQVDAEDKSMLKLSLLRPVDFDLEVTLDPEILDNPTVVRHITSAPIARTQVVLLLDSNSRLFESQQCDTTAGSSAPAIAQTKVFVGSQIQLVALHRDADQNLLLGSGNEHWRAFGAEVAPFGKSSLYQTITLGQVGEIVAHANVSPALSAPLALQVVPLGSTATIQVAGEFALPVSPQGLVRLSTNDQSKYQFTVDPRDAQGARIVGDAPVRITIDNQVVYHGTSRHPEFVAVAGRGTMTVEFDGVIASFESELAR